ncbi:hypothetical protein QFC20_003538 [Naganishia adeliensis]|uniref:Uncharacterized protein n=1 Tax=Naganishia adeliensis TaxID=92952 RepID=A0ACC2WBE1_9TREE|nr:hypothetical protein QFC20_003538 [Naganishia adeliensis]
MQSIKRTLSPITFDAHVEDDTRKKVFTPGELVAGVVRIKKDDVGDVKQAWVELVGEQMTQYGDKLFNPDLRPYQRMEKTFFNIRQDLPASEGVMGDWAYYNFSVRIPDSDRYVPAGSTEGAGDGKPLPPSLVVQPGNAKHSLQPVAYNRYYVRVCVESQGHLGRTTSQTLPFLLLPLGTNPPVPAAPWTDASAERSPHAPAEWTRYRPKEVWKIGNGEKASGGFLKGLLKRKEGEDKGKTEVRVVLSVPGVPTWPRNQPIPFHLRITTTNTTFDLSAIAINFQLFQKIRVVAKGMFEDHDAVRHSSEVEEVRKGREGKHAREEFEVEVMRDWVGLPEKNEALEGEITRVVEGTFRVGMMPSFVNGGLSCKYGLKLELLSLSRISSQVFSLLQPVISSGLRGGLPAYEEAEGLVPPAYWDVQVDGDEKSG